MNGYICTNDPLNLTITNVSSGEFETKIVDHDWSFTLLDGTQVTKIGFHFGSSFGSAGSFDGGLTNLRLVYYYLPSAGWKLVYNALALDPSEGNVLVSNWADWKYSIIVTNQDLSAESADIQDFIQNNFTWSALNYPTSVTSSTNFIDTNHEKIDNDGYTSWNGKAVLSKESVALLQNELQDTKLDELLFGDDVQWLQSLTYYPFSANGPKLNNITYPVEIFGRNVADIEFRRELDIKAQPFEANNSYFNMGEFYYTGYYGNFMDLDSYTSIQVFLPYYGFVDLSAKDCLDKYLQFRLKIDFNTGEGIWIIGVSDEHIEAPDQVILDTTTENFRVISTSTCRLGIEIPLTRTNATELTRNLVMASLKMAVTGVRFAAGMSAPPPTQSRDSIKLFTAEPIKTILPDSSSYLQNHIRVTPTSEMRVLGKLDGADPFGELSPTGVNAAKIASSMWKGAGGSFDKGAGRIMSPAEASMYTGLTAELKPIVGDDSVRKALTTNACLEQATAALNIGGASTATQPIAQANLMTILSKSIQIIVRRPKTVPITAAYDFIYGRPLGEFRELRDLSGYTEISAVRLTDTPDLLQDERLALQQALYGGIIL